MKNKTIVIVVLILAVIAAVVLTMKTNTAPRYKWHKTLETNMQQPYNVGLIKEMLKSRAATFSAPASELAETLRHARQSDTPATYIFIGHYIYLTSEEAAELLAFAAEGNQVFIAAESLPDSIIETLTYGSKKWLVNEVVSDRIKVNFEHPALKSSQPYSFKFCNKLDSANNTISWYYIGISEEEQTEPSYYTIEDTRFQNYTRISHFGADKTNCISVPYGNGHIWYHTNPILFSNFFLLDSSGFEHSDKVLSHLPLTHIIWDEGSRTYKKNSQPFAHKDDSPLSYVLSQPALKWAWYLLVSIALIFIIFRSKREQRVIPVLEKNTNTTLQFVDTMSGMFFQSGNHSNIAEIRMSSFLWFIRNRLGIATHDMDDKTYALIAVKAKVPEAHVRSIFEYYNNVIQGKQIDEEQLIRFHELTVAFYKYFYKG